MVLCVACAPARASGEPPLLPTGQRLTPTAAPGSVLQRLRTLLRADGGADADGAVACVRSPDGTAMLVLTTGYDTTYYTSAGTPIVHAVLDPLTARPTTTMTPAAQWVFVYDIRAAVPRVAARINLPFSYNGVVWDPHGLRFYVSGGPTTASTSIKRSTARPSPPRRLGRRMRRSSCSGTTRMRSLRSPRKTAACSTIRRPVLRRHASRTSPSPPWRRDSR